MNLYQLQSSWDDDRARQRTQALRAQIRPQVQADRRWLPLIFLAGLAATIGTTLIAQALV